MGQLAPRFSKAVGEIGPWHLAKTCGGPVIFRHA